MEVIFESLACLLAHGVWLWPHMFSGCKSGVRQVGGGDPVGVSGTDWLILLRAVAARRALFFTAFSAPVRSEAR